MLTKVQKKYCQHSGIISTKILSALFQSPLSSSIWRIEIPANSTVISTLFKKMDTVPEFSPLMRTEWYICMILLNALRTERKRAGKSKDLKISERVILCCPCLQGPEAFHVFSLTGVWPHKMTLSDRKPLDMNDNLTGVWWGICALLKIDGIVSSGSENPRLREQTSHCHAHRASGWVRSMAAERGGLRIIVLLLKRTMHKSTPASMSAHQLMNLFHIQCCWPLISNSLNFWHISATTHPKMGIVEMAQQKNNTSQNTFKESETQLHNAHLPQLYIPDRLQAGLTINS